MNYLNSMEYIPLEEDNKTFVISGVPSIDESSLTKTGDILRNDQGQYVFMCFHCGLFFDDFGEIRSHCETHFMCEQKFNIDLPTTEPVYFEQTDPRLDDKLSSRVDMNVQPTESTDLMYFKKSGSDVKEIIKTSKTKRKTSASKKKVSKKSETSAAHSITGQDPVLDVPQNCPMCDEWCDNFRDHLLTTHKFKGRFFQCYMCQKFFQTRQNLLNHMSSATHGKFKCYHCEMEPPVTNPSDPRRHKCLFCKQWYPNHNEFKVHFKDAHNKDADCFFHKRSNCNIFTCYVCEREFPLRYYLVSHMKSHYDKFLRHICPTCGRRFRTFGLLTQHLKTHEGKIYECEQCDKKFNYYVRLRLHRASHRTELNFKCDICSKAFKVKKYLNKHMAVHNDKKYGCKFCPATFNFTSGRRAHEKSQHKAL
ncbi:Zinc finger protein [Pseudolycoriella hygida]|uniref:Zinc finger protein n=1 Tax=Pseudolycoriella hygida TaxID=35572 RepID=A0A9Q0NBB5_9DIPT|nr:Zinc finger protein [Pseudolycoriella hygida]